MTKSSSKSDTPLFAEKLKALRLARNLSLRDCEKKAGKALSRQTFLRAEQGSVALDNLLRMLTIFKASKVDAEEVLRLFHQYSLSQAHQEAAA